MATSLITVAAVTNSAEAQFVVNRLQEVGIEATVADDNIVSMDYLFGPAVGWIKVQVREGDADRAEEHLAEAATPADLAEIPWEQPPEEQEEDEHVTPEEHARLIEERTAPDEVDPTLTATEQLITRAYRQAIIGLFLFPPLLNLNSLMLLRSVGKEESEKLPGVYLRQSSMAFLTNFLSIIAFGWIWIAAIIYTIGLLIGM
jgi:hypothetical protein